MDAGVPVEDAEVLEVIVVRAGAAPVGEDGVLDLEVDLVALGRAVGEGAQGVGLALVDGVVDDRVDDVGLDVFGAARAERRAVAEGGALVAWAGKG